MSFARCPRCQMEFSQGFAFCALCGKPLEPGLHPAAETDCQSWVVVAKARTAAEAEILAGALQSAGIPVVSEARGVTMYPAPEGGLSVYLIRVLRSDVTEALELKELAERGDLSFREEEIEEEIKEET